MPVGRVCKTARQVTRRASGTRPITVALSGVVIDAWAADQTNKGFGITPYEAKEHLLVLANALPSGAKHNKHVPTDVKEKMEAKTSYKEGPRNAIAPIPLLTSHIVHGSVAVTWSF